MADNNKKNVALQDKYISWCRPSDEPFGKKDKNKAREAEGKLTPAGKTLVPGGSPDSKGNAG